MVLESVVTAYRQALEALLPRGKVWRARIGGDLETLWQAIAAEFAKVGDRVQDLLVEADPFETTELLPDWEKMAGLPSDCTGPLPNAQLRRAALVAQLSTLGPATPAEFEAYAATLGYTVVVEDNLPFRSGESSCNDPIQGIPWIYTWDVHAAEFNPIFAEAGAAVAGDPLMAWSSELLECAVEAFRPAHTIVRFVYDLEWDGYSPWGPWIRPDPIAAQGRVPSVGVTNI